MIPGAARFALAPGYLKVAPSALTPGYLMVAPSALTPGYLMVAPSALTPGYLWSRLRRSEPKNSAGKLTENGDYRLVAGDAAEREADAEVAF